MLVQYASVRTRPLGVAFWHQLFLYPNAGSNLARSPVVLTSKLRQHRRMLTPRLLLLYAAAILAKVPDSALAAPLTMAEADINAHAQGDNSATSLSTDNHAEFGT